MSSATEKRRRRSGRRLPGSSLGGRQFAIEIGRRAVGAPGCPGGTQADLGFLPSVASPIICRSALTIEAHRGVASLANTARYGLRDAPCAALRWLRAAYDI
ncbi:hypothetical protein Veis_3629 [Verminephrobacter eiseniae EF01-2]|uniref:Uncharacterized protein n=1 Tax=Verminephrobacter eiseniae (strain EF01-2) TaxID=391735 RepID=A1WNY8_VEREI|nr:hypothetical protein Veis_3629 [Verminephrobacter eiseniae EF01-2]